MQMVRGCRVACSAMTTVTEPLTPDDIDLGVRRPARARARGRDRRRRAGRHRRAATQLVVLNPTAALIFQFLDGEATLGELVDDFTDALGVDRDVVEDDVLTFVRELGANGLLEGVALPQPEIDPTGATTSNPSPRLEPGDELDDFTLPDLDGAERSLSDYRGKRVAARQLEPGLRVLRDDRRRARRARTRSSPSTRSSSLFVTIGDADANRALIERARTHRADAAARRHRRRPVPRAPAPRRRTCSTSDGTLVETMVVGADQVPSWCATSPASIPATPYGVVDERRRRRDDDDERRSDDEVRGQYLPAPGAMCGPGGGGRRVEQHRLERHPRLRARRLPRRPPLRRRRDRRRARPPVPGARVNDRRVPDNYSVALGGTPTTNGAGASQSFKLLVHGSTNSCAAARVAVCSPGCCSTCRADLEPADPSLTRGQRDRDGARRRGAPAPGGLVDFVKQLQPRLAKARTHDRRHAPHAASTSRRASSSCPSRSCPTTRR